MMKVKKNSPICLLAVLPFALITLLFEILPLINIVIESFTKQGGGGFTFDHFIKIFTTRLYQQSIFNSVWTVSYTHLDVYKRQAWQCRI